MSTLRNRIDAMGRKPPAIFGDEKDFAIRFVPGYRSGGFDHAWLHLVIGGQVIGNVLEDCVASTWLNGIGDLLDRVENAPERLSHPAFAGLRDDELFAIIWKANGAVDPAYTHLPTLPGRVWSDCRITIDETTDAWSIAMVLVDDRLKFLWKGWRWGHARSIAWTGCTFTKRTQRPSPRSFGRLGTMWAVPSEASRVPIRMENRERRAVKWKGSWRRRWIFGGCCGSCDRPLKEVERPWMVSTLCPQTIRIMDCRNTLTAFCLSLLPALAWSQTAVTVLEINQVWARLMSTGLIGAIPTAGINGFRIPYPQTTSPLYTTGLWLSGTTAGNETRCSAHLYGSLRDFAPGPLTTDGAASLSPEAAMAYDRFWTVDRFQVEQFIAYSGCVEDPDCDAAVEFPGYAIPNAFLQWPAMGDVDAAQAQYLAPFVDHNGDGHYDPFDGDHPCLPGHRAIYHIFNDNNQAQTGGVPMGMEVHMTFFAYAGGLPELAQTVFARYRVINRSSQTYPNFRIGVFADFDLGCYSDDLVGTDVGRNLLYVVNGSDNDASCASPGYGPQPPAFGIQVLKGPLMDPDGIDNISEPPIPAFNGTGFNDGVVDNERHGLDRSMYFNGAGNPSMTDPSVETHYINYMQGRWKDGLSLTYGGDGYNGSVPSAFAFPGDTDPDGVGTDGIPQAPWTETTAGNMPADRKAVAIMGPVTMEPGAEQEILVAYVYARATAGGAWGSVEALQERADALRSWAADVAGLIDDAPSCSDLLTGITAQGSLRGPLRFHPNPVTDMLLIAGGDLPRTAVASIHDLRGALVMRQQYQADGPGLAVEGLAPGMYILRLESLDGILTGRFIKN